MNALAPLVGVLVLSIVLVTNFFRAAWRLGILRAFGRRHPLSWRSLAAGALAACLPLIGAVLALTLIPGDSAGELATDAGRLALELSGAGFLMHLFNDHLVRWGRVPVAS